MKKYAEYILLLLLMVPIMVPSIRLVIDDTLERSEINEALKEIAPKAVEKAIHAPSCDMNEIPHQFYEVGGRKYEAYYLIWEEGKFKIYINSNFRDGYKFQTYYNFKYRINPVTKDCDLEAIQLIPTVNSNELKSGGGFNWLALMNYLPRFQCD